jgi:hypothetical protein
LLVRAEEITESQGKMIDKFWKWAKEHRRVLFMILAVFYMIKAALYLIIGAAAWKWVTGN